MEAGPRGDPGVHVHGPAEEEYSFHTASAPTPSLRTEGSTAWVREPSTSHATPRSAPRTVMARAAAAAPAAHPWRRAVFQVQGFPGCRQKQALEVPHFGAACSAPHCAGRAWQTQRETALVFGDMDMEDLTPNQLMHWGRGRALQKVRVDSNTPPGGV